MNEWLKVKAEALMNERKEIVQGVRVTVFTSPYDLPIAFRGGCERPGSSVFVIEFRYRDEESVKRESAGPNISVDIGVSSGRLHRISIDLESFNANAVALDFEEAVSDALKQLNRRTTVRNSDVTQQIISQNRADIFRTELHSE